MELETLYETMVQEELKPSTSGTIKAGDGFEGEEKAQVSAIKSPKPTDADGIKQKTPVEGPSQGKEQGKPKDLTKTVESAQDEVGELIPLTFDQLYQKTINEEDDDMISPASDIESDDFSEDTGDFESEETDVDEEVDLASELRLLSDRLSEIADKLSVDDDDGEIDGDLSDVGDDVGDDVGSSPAGSEFLSGESVRRKGKSIQEDISNEPEPKPLKKSSLGPKMSQNPKNKIGKSGASKAATPMTKDRTGEPSVLPKSKFGPNMSQNPDGSGPAVKAGNTDLIS